MQRLAFQYWLSATDLRRDPKLVVNFTSSAGLDFSYKIDSYSPTIEALSPCCAEPLVEDWKSAYYPCRLCWHATFLPQTGPASVSSWQDDQRALEVLATWFDHAASSVLESPLWADEVLALVQGLDRAISWAPAEDQACLTHEELVRSALRRLGVEPTEHELALIYATAP